MSFEVLEVVCPNCEGIGCPECGRGLLRIVTERGEEPKPCKWCEGTGKNVLLPCDFCHGTGVEGTV